MSEKKDGELPKKEEMTVLKAILNFFGPGAMEDFKRGWNRVKAEQEAAVKSSTAGKYPPGVNPPLTETQATTNLPPVLPADKPYQQGRIKWFSSEKGYGFIVGDDNIERYYNVRDIQGADLPQQGDTVAFLHRQGKKGARAAEIHLMQRQQQDNHDDRATCAACHKKMVPRIVFENHAPAYSVCPFCMTVYKDFREDPRCFIATAIYADSDAPQVKILRQYRDTILRQTRWGQMCIKTYYRYSPPIAAYLRRHRHLCTILRPLFNLLTTTIRHLYKLRRG